MKQIKNLAWMSAIALAGTMTFAACSSDDDKVENINPTYDGKSVKTQFAINIPRAAQTRQTAEITQNNSNFRGMQDIKLIPMIAGTIDGTTTETFAKVIDLDAATTNEINASSSHKIYSDVEIPVETKSFLFYGQATIDNTDNSHANNGILSPNGLTEGGSVSGITFTLQNMLHTTELNSAFNNAGTTLTGYLNEIISVRGWKDTENLDLKEAYTQLSKLKVCSSGYILKMMQEVYNIAENLTSHATYGNLATSITNAIASEGKPFTINSGTLAFSSSDSNITNFPTQFGYPFGAIALSFNETNGTFSKVQEYIGSTDNHVKVSSICYPAALYYFTNTNLYANNNTMDNWPQTPSTWDTPANWNGWSNKVTAATQSIALKNNIQYGVSLLKTIVKTSANTLKDNAKIAGGQTVDQTIPVTDTSFPLTGILIGGQPSQLGWDMLATTSANFDQTIYDNKMNGNIYATTTNSTANYTLALDNTKATEKPVHIAIELQNNSGLPFYGVDGIVPIGSKFYLIAKLDPTSGTGNHEQPFDGANVPNHVFIQDYTTAANLTIKSLQNAYVTIPDLRSTKLQLGLSVDLEWKSGLVFNLDIN